MNETDNILNEKNMSNLIGIVRNFDTAEKAVVLSELVKSDPHLYLSALASYMEDMEQMVTNIKGVIDLTESRWGSVD